MVSCLNLNNVITKEYNGSFSAKTMNESFKLVAQEPDYTLGCVYDDWGQKLVLDRIAPDSHSVYLHPENVDACVVLGGVAHSENAERCKYSSEFRHTIPVKNEDNADGSQSLLKDNSKNNSSNISKSPTVCTLRQILAVMRDKDVIMQHESKQLCQHRRNPHHKSESSDTDLLQLGKLLQRRVDEKPVREHKQSHKYKQRHSNHHVHTARRKESEFPSRTQMASRIAFDKNLNKPSITYRSRAQKKIYSPVFLQSGNESLCKNAEDQSISVSSQTVVVDSYSEESQSKDTIKGTEEIKNRSVAKTVASVFEVQKRIELVDKFPTQHVGRVDCGQSQSRQSSSTPTIELPIKYCQITFENCNEETYASCLFPNLMPKFETNTLNWSSNAGSSGVTWKDECDEITASPPSCCRRPWASLGWGNIALINQPCTRPRFVDRKCENCQSNRRKPCEDSDEDGDDFCGDPEELNTECDICDQVTSSTDSSSDDVCSEKIKKASIRKKKDCADCDLCSGDVLSNETSQNSDEEGCICKQFRIQSDNVASCDERLKLKACASYRYQEDNDSTTDDASSESTVVEKSEDEATSDECELCSFNDTEDQSASAEEKASSDNTRCDKEVHKQQRAFDSDKEDKHAENKTENSYVKNRVSEENKNDPCRSICPAVKAVRICSVKNLHATFPGVSCFKVKSPHASSPNCSMMTSSGIICCPIKKLPINSTPCGAPQLQSSKQPRQCSSNTSNELSDSSGSSTVRSSEFPDSSEPCTMDGKSSADVRSINKANNRNSLTSKPPKERSSNDCPCSNAPKKNADKESPVVSKVSNKILQNASPTKISTRSNSTSKLAAEPPNKASSDAPSDSTKISSRKPSPEPSSSNSTDPDKFISNKPTKSARSNVDRSLHDRLISNSSDGSSIFAPKKSRQKSHCPKKAAQSRDYSRRKQPQCLPTHSSSPSSAATSCRRQSSHSDICRPTVASSQDICSAAIVSSDGSCCQQKVVEVDICSPETTKSEATALSYAPGKVAPKVEEIYEEHEESSWLGWLAIVIGIAVLVLLLLLYVEDGGVDPGPISEDDCGDCGELWFWPKSAIT